VRRPPAPQITRAEVTGIIWALMRIEAKLDRLLEELEINGGEEADDS